jgi:soluble lytic murein transglycosylase-like protein
MLQKTSFGLMQVMGAVFREYGFEGWLSQIVTSPELQLEFGCKHLSKKIRRYGKESGIAAYNAGSPRRKPDGKFVNQYYVDNVLRYASTATELL